MIEEMQSSISDESDPNQLRSKMVHILGEGPKHEHRDSGISAECECTVYTASSMTCALIYSCSGTCVEKDAKSGKLLSA